MLIKLLIYISVYILIYNESFGNVNKDNVLSYLGSFNTLKSDFIQVNNSGEILSGNLHISRPGKFRIEYNQIPLLLICDSKKLAVINKDLKKLINRIKTNLLEPGEPKNADDSAVFHLWCAFSDESEISSMRLRFNEGIGWGDAKKMLFEKVNDQLSAPRDNFQRLMDDGIYIETILKEGAVKAREESMELIAKVRKAVGIASLG